MIKRKAAEKLKESVYNVGDQFPKEIQQRRRKLVPILKKAQSEGKQAVLVYDKLFINGVKYQEEISRSRPVGQRQRQSRSNGQGGQLRSPGTQFHEQIKIADLDLLTVIRFCRTRQTQKTTVRQILGRC